MSKLRLIAIALPLLNGFCFARNATIPTLVVAPNPLVCHAGTLVPFPNLSGCGYPPNELGIINSEDANGYGYLGSFYSDEKGCFSVDMSYVGIGCESWTMLVKTFMKKHNPMSSAILTIIAQ